MSENHDSTVRLLIAETDRIVARDLELILQSQGYSILGVPSAVDEVISLIEEERPDLILLSVKFGGENGGVKLAQRLRDEHSLPVIFITGHTGEAVFEMARTARPMGYVRKPFSHAELIASVEAAIPRIKPDQFLKDRIPAIRSIADPLEESVIVSGIDGRIVLMNGSAEELTGWGEEEASGLLYSEVVLTSHPENDEHDVEDNRSTCLFTDRNGRLHSVVAITSPVRDESTELLGTITILKDRAKEEKEEDDESKDVTFRKRAAILKTFSNLSGSSAFQNLVGDKGKVSEEKSDEDAIEPSPHDPLMDQLGDPLVILNHDLRILQANLEAISAFDCDEALPGKSFWELFSEEELERFEDEFLRPLMDGRRHRFEFQDSNRATWYEVRLYRTHEGVIALFHDITDTRLTKAEEVRQHRLEGLGLLARGFAHDFNNHLTAVTGNLGLARDTNNDPELQEMLGEAELATSHAADLVQQLMTFATGGRPVREPVKIPELVRQVLSEHRRGRPSIRFQFQCTEPELKANLDRAQIRRVVENMINNAEEALPNGGTLIVRCGKITPKRVASFETESPPSREDHVLIEVIDNGIGMNPETLEKAFEPYFSERSDDNATGIGLTVCDSIAKAHEGFVHLKSTPGKGTEAIFCVPLGLQANRAEWKETKPAKEEAAPTQESNEDSLISFDRTQKRILILEDDGPIRRLMGATLRRAGYVVVETKEGTETVAEYRNSFENGNRFDLVISDLTIEQGMGGIETMAQLREMDPDVIAIVSSGYSDASAMSNPSAFGFKGVIPKPYSTEQLQKTVDRILATYSMSEASL